MTERQKALAALLFKDPDVEIRRAAMVRESSPVPIKLPMKPKNVYKNNGELINEWAMRQHRRPCRVESGNRNSI